jgi:hypothetical protein
VKLEFSFKKQRYLAQLDKILLEQNYVSIKTELFLGEDFP